MAGPCRDRRVGEFWWVTNHWGWTPRGVLHWMRAGWAFLPTTWGIEAEGSDPPRYTKILKWGPLCTRIR